MSHILENSVAGSSQADERVFAKLDARISWEDKQIGEERTIVGVTENIGINSALIAVEVLPPVGEALTLVLSDNGKEIISIETSVIRVERDPAKPKAALSVTKNREKWVEAVLPAAQNWVTNDLKINYEGDDWLN